MEPGPIDTRWHDNHPGQRLNSDVHDRTRWASSKQKDQWRKAARSAGQRVFNPGE